MDEKTARVIHRFSGWPVPISLRWFSGGYDQQVINGTPWVSLRSAVRPAWVTGCKRLPCPLLGVVLFPLEEVHVVTQEDERVGAGTCAEDMAVVVDVAGRDQRCHVTAPHGAVLYKSQFGPAVFMPDRVPPLMGFHPADRGTATQQWWEWV